jgi:hypothetical protein
MNDQLALTIDPLQDAVYWAEHHPDQLAFILNLWELDKAARIPPSADYYWHCLRRSGLVHRPVARNDRFTSSLGRYLKREYGIPCRNRKAKVDGYGGTA